MSEQGKGQIEQQQPVREQVLIDKGSNAPASNCTDDIAAFKDKVIALTTELNECKASQDALKQEEEEKCATEVATNIKKQEDRCLKRISASNQLQFQKCTEKLEEHANIAAESMKTEKEKYQSDLMNCNAAPDSFLNSDGFYTVRIMNKIVGGSAPLIFETMEHVSEAQQALNSLVTILMKQYSDVIEPAGREFIITSGGVWNGMVTFVGNKFDAKVEPIIEEVEAKVGVSRSMIRSKSNEFLDGVTPYYTTTLHEMDKLALLAQGYISQGHSLITKSSSRGVELIGATLDEYPEVKSLIPRSRTEAFEGVFFLLTLWSIIIVTKKLLCFMSCFIKKSLFSVYAIICYLMHSLFTVVCLPCNFCGAVKNVVTKPFVKNKNDDSVNQRKTTGKKETPSMTSGSRRTRKPRVTK